MDHRIIRCLKYSVYLYIFRSFYSYAVYSMAEGCNIALNKVAKQGPKDFLNQTAGLAVDGNISQNADAGLCAHTNGTGTAWWSVDFNGSYFLSGIRIIRRLKGKYRELI